MELIFKFHTTWISIRWT